MKYTTRQRLERERWQRDLTVILAVTKTLSPDAPVSLSSEEHEQMIFETHMRMRRDAIMAGPPEQVVDAMRFLFQHGPAQPSGWAAGATAAVEADVNTTNDSENA